METVLFCYDFLKEKGCLLLEINSGSNEVTLERKCYIVIR